MTSQNGTRRAMIGGLFWTNSICVSRGNWRISSGDSKGRPVSLKESFTEAERAAIETALAECNGVVGGKYGAAARLGLKRQTLQSKMKKLGISLGKSRGGAPDPPSSTAV